jgi:hypothetical protein
MQEEEDGQLTSVDAAVFCAPHHQQPVFNSNSASLVFLAHPSAIPRSNTLPPVNAAQRADKRLASPFRTLDRHRDTPLPVLYHVGTVDGPFCHFENEDDVL